MTHLLDVLEKDHTQQEIAIRRLFEPTAWPQIASILNEECENYIRTLSEMTAIKAKRIQSTVDPLADAAISYVDDVKKQGRSLLISYYNRLFPSPVPHIQRRDKDTAKVCPALSAIHTVVDAMEPCQDSTSAIPAPTLLYLGTVPTQEKQPAFLVNKFLWEYRFYIGSSTRIEATSVYGLFKHWVTRSREAHRVALHHNSPVIPMYNCLHSEFTDADHDTFFVAFCRLMSHHRHPSVRAECTCVEIDGKNTGCLYYRHINSRYRLDGDQLVAAPPDLSEHRSVVATCTVE